MEGVDAGYLYLETPSMHMHTLKIALIHPPRRYSFPFLRGELLARLDRLPPFQRRAVAVPLALNHPLWLADHELDPDRHVVRHDLPAGAAMPELEALIGEIASTPLDRSAPLWEVHVAEGLADGRIAVVAKIHHALADGAVANALLSNLTDEAAADAGRPATTHAPEPTPSRRRQVWLALRDATVQLFTLPRLLWRTGTAVTALVRGRRASSDPVPRPVLDVPRVAFNAALTPRRSFATVTLPLEELKAVRHRHGVTLNDVVLAVVSGALRAWLAERGELPARSLVAGVPVATDQPGSGPRLAGNRVSNLFTSLATDVADPVARLHLISRTTAASKEVHATLGPQMLVDWVQFAPPGPLTGAMRLYSRFRTASRHAPPFNLVVSNVPGPREPLRIAAAELDDLFSVGPILEGIGLNVTAWSYVDRMNFSLLCCPDLVPDLAPLVAHFRPALDELLRMEAEHR